MTKSVATKALISTLSAAGLFVAGTQVANADTINIAAGDTVSAYAAQYNVSIDDIVKANKLADANLIIAGHSIEIPGATSSATTSSAVAASSAVADSTVASTDATSAVAASSTTDTTTTAAPATTTAAPASAGSSSAVATALSMVGVPYVWGGTTPAGFDCSGLVQYAYGLSQRTTNEQATIGAHHYDVTNAPAGALVFWGSDSAPYHVGISLGNGQYVAAPEPGQSVKTGSMQYYMPSFYINM